MVQQEQLSAVLPEVACDGPCCGAQPAGADQLVGVCVQEPVGAAVCADDLVPGAVADQILARGQTPGGAQGPEVGIDDQGAFGVRQYQAEADGQWNSAVPAASGALVARDLKLVPDEAVPPRTPCASTGACPSGRPSRSGGRSRGGRGP